jgi:hypothetical protein
MQSNNGNQAPPIDVHKFKDVRGTIGTVEECGHVISYRGLKGVTTQSAADNNLWGHIQKVTKAKMVSAVDDGTLDTQQHEPQGTSPM